MAKTIKIQSGKQVISIESDDAGVPDVTEGTGPDLMELQDDAMAEPNEANAEFNAAIDDSAVESEDKPQSVEEVASESFFNSIFGLEDGEEAAVTGGDEPEQSDNPVTPEETTPEETTTTDEGGEGDGEGAGDVTEGDGVTTIDTGDTVITISSSDDTGDDAPAAEETPAPAEETPAPAETSAEENADPEQNTDQAIESFFRNMGL